MLVTSNRLQGGLKMNIIDFIPYGEKNAIKKENLLKLTNLSDRDLRNAIELAKKDYPICNLQNGKGYFIADDIDIAIKMLRQEMSRAISIIKSCSGLKSFIKIENEKNQIYIDNFNKKV